MHRRSLLLGALAMPALAQTDLLPAPQTVRQDDWIAPGYARDVLIRWGDRVAYDAPAWDPRMPGVAAASTQFGWDGRILGVAIPPAAADNVPRAVLAVAHAEVWPAMAFAGPDRPDVASAMQGASLLNLELQRGRWIVVDGGFQARRFWTRTLCGISGPAAGEVGGSVQGLLNVQGGCVTPWGTLLLAEGDPAGWFGRLASVPDFADRKASQFGWVAEVDPLDPLALPVKRTALGRFAHADTAAAVTADGRAVVYLSEGRAFGGLYRFVSAGPAGEANALDAGTLSVARIEGGSLRWAPLGEGAQVATPDAARRAGAGAFDTPAGVALDPRGGRLFLACSGNPARSAAQVDVLNPRAGNAAGHVIALDIPGGDHTAERYGARVLILAGETLGEGAVLPNPETLFCDAAGRLWVGTDQGGRASPVADGLYAVSAGSAVPLYLAPVGGALGNAAILPDGRTLVAMVRRPGAVAGANFDRPATRWPQLLPNVPPRSALISITRGIGGPPGG
jgi:secreted PhoX family phosphatase